MSTLLQLVQNSKAFLKAQQGLATEAIVESQVSRLQNKLASSIIGLDEATGLVEEVADGSCFTAAHQGILLEAINQGTLNTESELSPSRRPMQEITHIHRFFTERDVAVISGASGRVGVDWSSCTYTYTGIHEKHLLTVLYRYSVSVRPEFSMIDHTVISL